MSDGRDRIPLLYVAIMAGMAGAILWSILWTIVLMVR